LKRHRARLGFNFSKSKQTGVQKKKVTSVLMPYATVKSLKFSSSMSIFIKSMGTGEPATIPVLTNRNRYFHSGEFVENIPKPLEINGVACGLASFNFIQYTQKVRRNTM